MRLIPALLAAAGVAAPAAAQTSTVYSRAALPPQPALDRLNLRTEWAANVPVAGLADGVARVQPAGDTQVFVQTRFGLFLALDAVTGDRQWTYQLANAAEAHPVAVTDRFVFVVNVIRLYCFHRYTGVVEFEYNLPGQPTAGPAADAVSVFVTLSGQRVMAFDLPPPVRLPDEPRAARGLTVGSPRRVNPADVVAQRYPGGAGVVRTAAPEPEFDPIRVQVDGYESRAGQSTSQRSPSLTSLPSIVPPYNLFTRDGRYIVQTPSLNALATLRQPYSIYDPTRASGQRTPSVTVIPPSVAGIYEMIDLRPRNVEPALKWVFGASERMRFQPAVTPFNVWTTGEGRSVLAVDKFNRAVQATLETTAPAAAPMAVAEGVGYVGLTDGSLYAFNTDRAEPLGAQAWRTPVGGPLTRKPVPTADGVYASGDHAGVARLDRRTGGVLWRTEASYDRLLAVNDEFAYVRDRLGTVSVFDRVRVSDPRTGLARPLASIGLAGFNLPVTNDQTDRIYLAAENGLLVCLRDNSPKYARPLVVAPPPVKPPPPPLPGGTPPAGTPPPQGSTAPAQLTPAPTGAANSGGTGASTPPTQPNQPKQ